MGLTSVLSSNLPNTDSRTLLDVDLLSKIESICEDHTNAFCNDNFTCTDLVFITHPKQIFSSSGAPFAIILSIATIFLCFILSPLILVLSTVACITVTGASAILSRLFLVSAAKV